MSLPACIRSGLALSLLVFASTALAHDPLLHELEEGVAPKAIPTTCEQYADRENYSNDLTDPDIKVLKDRCDAQKKDATTDQAAEPAPAKDDE